MNLIVESMIKNGKVIENVIIKERRVNPDERGNLMEILRRDEDFFKGFGQTYATEVYPGVTKGWHYHKEQTDNFVCVSGMIKLVLFDVRENSKTYKKVNELFIGEKDQLLVQIPPYVLHGFKGVGTDKAIIINVCTKPYNYNKPDEYRVHPHDKDLQKQVLGFDVPYNWARKDG